MEKTLELSDFLFELPEAMIAQTPTPERSHAKLLVREAEGRISHHVVRQLPKILTQPCLFVVNNSKVIPARIFGESPTGAHIEFLLLSFDKEKLIWDAMVKPKRRLKNSSTIRFAEGLMGTIVSIDGDMAQSCKIQFDRQGSDFYQWLDKYGQMPLPPYIQRKVVDGQQSQGDLDQARYQTVFATSQGSVAAPTASLHFDDAVMQDLRNYGCDFAEVTLHVGAGTFLPITSTHLSEHMMHYEYFCVPSLTLAKITAAKKQGTPIIGVGTTSLRSLEALNKISQETGTPFSSLTDHWHRTNLFIYPQREGEIFRPWCLDALMTNFHQPNSTLFILISALIGHHEAKNMYLNARNNGYRFLSYGDSSLLWL